MSKPRHIADLIKPGPSGFPSTLARARRLQELESVVKGLLSPEFSGEVRVANLRNTTLVLVTPSAAIAARLRMEAPDLASALRTLGADDIERIELRVAPLQFG